MPRTYETVVIFDSSMDESEVEERVERYRKILTGGDGPFRVTPWGKRKLAFPIRKKEQGIYSILRYEAEPEALNEFERIVRLDEQVLRHLTVVNPVEAPAAEAGDEGREPGAGEED